MFMKVNAQILFCCGFKVFPLLWLSISNQHTNAHKIAFFDKIQRQQLPSSCLFLGEFSTPLDFLFLPLQSPNHSLPNHSLPVVFRAQPHSEKAKTENILEQMATVCSLAKMKPQRKGNWQKFSERLRYTTRIEHKHHISVKIRGLKNKRFLSNNDNFGTYLGKKNFMHRML